MKKQVLRIGEILLLVAMLFLSACGKTEQPPADTDEAAEPIRAERLQSRAPADDFR